MVKALPIARRDTEHFVDWIIEVAAYPGRSNTRLFGFEIEDLPDETGFPKEPSVEARAVCDQAVRVVGKHRQAEGSIPGDVLAAGDPRCQRSAVPFLEQVKRKATRA